MTVFGNSVKKFLGDCLKVKVFPSHSSSHMGKVLFFLGLSTINIFIVGKLNGLLTALPSVVYFFSNNAF